MGDGSEKHGDGERASAGVAGAELEVARASAEFSASLRDASLVGQETAKRVASKVRPVLIGIGLLAATALFLTLVRGRRRSVRFRSSSPPARSLWWGLASSATLSLASAGGRALAARWLSANVRDDDGR